MPRRLQVRAMTEKETTADALLEHALQAAILTPFAIGMVDGMIADFFFVPSVLHYLLLIQKFQSVQDETRCISDWRHTAPVRRQTFKHPAAHKPGPLKGLCLGPLARLARPCGQQLNLPPHNEMHPMKPEIHSFPGNLMLRL